MREIMFGLTEKTYEEITQILSKYPKIEKVIIYGSRAKGNYRNGSDIDITLVGKELELDINFNLLDNPELKEHIDRAGKIFYSQTPLKN